MRNAYLMGAALVALLPIAAQAQPKSATGGVSKQVYQLHQKLITLDSHLDTPASLDLPERHRLTMRYSLNPKVRFTGSYEAAKGRAIDARTLRAGRQFGADRSLTGIAHDAGYTDSAHLARTWHRVYGLSPSQVRRHNSVQASSP